MWSICKKYLSSNLRPYWSTMKSELSCSHVLPLETCASWFKLLRRFPIWTLAGVLIFIAILNELHIANLMTCV